MDAIGPGVDDQRKVDLGTVIGKQVLECGPRTADYSGSR